MSKRQDRLQRIRAVEREYLAATVAVDLLEEQLRANPAYLVPFELRNRDAGQLRANLEATFLIRVFAEFESGLRDAWDKAFGRTTHPPLRDLLPAIAALRLVPQDWLDEADEVRAYRNTLVHEGESNATIIPLDETRRRLCRYFSHLPRDW